MTNDNDRRFRHSPAAIALLLLGVGGPLVTLGATLGACAQTKSPTPAAVEAKPATREAKLEKEQLRPMGIAARPTKKVCGSRKRKCRAIVRTDGAGTPLMTEDATGLVPKDIQEAYRIPSSGKPATVAIVVAYDDPTAEADLLAYRHHFGLPDCTTKNGCFKKLNGSGGTKLPPPPPKDSDWKLETSIDLDAVSATCPWCHILLIEATDDGEDESLYEAVREAGNHHGATVISASWGGAEEDNEQALDDKYLSHLGVATFFASGDEGYGPSYPAASPNVWSVGGTTLTEVVGPDGAARTWKETVWNNSSGATGGGCSKVEPRPPFQANVVDDTCSNRLMNDVAAVADPETSLAVYRGGWTPGSGTSLATAIVAGIFAATGRGAEGPAYAYENSATFHDVDTGNNVTESWGACACPDMMCTARAGYDGPTGNGTPIGTLLMGKELHP